ncbi:hypothetical protein K1T71_005270 [Dendrolimus kikuchii]|uniref:Uncharacterized protein n=1 Tax=Dendrolimus kikuchii TaxID=765133 RepID=A0ACC1D6L8_9NEOP|nr:hypothetical protein K1T71_005270 [Dendrolimus kikuchii]
MPDNVSLCQISCKSFKKKKKICINTFSLQEIAIAKELLFGSISTTIKKVTRRANKENKDVEDIISAFKNTDPDKTPIFVAWELQKLPPLTFDHIDITRLLKDIIVLQSEISKIKETCVTVDQLENIRTEMQNLKYASIINNSPQNGSVKRSAYMLDSGPHGFLNISNTYNSKKSPEKETVHAPNQVIDTLSQSLLPQTNTGQSNAVPFTAGVRSEGQNHTPATGRLCVRNDNSNMTTPISAHSGGDRDNQREEAAYHTVANVVTNQTVEVNSANSENKKSIAIVLNKEGVWKPEHKNDNWIQIQRKRYRNRTHGITGKALINPNDKFKPAEQKVPLFVSNVHKDTSEDDVIQYILNKTNEKVILQKIKMKQEKTYNAYKILVTKYKLDIFLKDDIWPQGVTCRRFMPYKSHEQK